MLKSSRFYCIELIWYGALKSSYFFSKILKKAWFIFGFFSCFFILTLTFQLLRLLSGRRRKAGLDRTGQLADRAGTQLNCGTHIAVRRVICRPVHSACRWSYQTERHKDHRARRFSPTSWSIALTGGWQGISLLRTIIMYCTNTCMHVSGWQLSFGVISSALMDGALDLIELINTILIPIRCIFFLKICLKKISRLTILGPEQFWNGWPIEKSSRVRIRKDCGYVGIVYNPTTGQGIDWLLHLGNKTPSSSADESFNKNGERSLSWPRTRRASS